MPLTIALPLFVGLGARVLLGYIFSPALPIPSVPGGPAAEPPFSPGDFILFGVWQGVGLYHSFSAFPEAATFVVGLAIAAKLLSDLSSGEIFKSLCVFIGVALGVLFTDILAQLIEDDVLGFNGSPRPKSSSQIPRRILQLGGDLQSERAAMKHAYEMRSARDREKERKRHERAFRAAKSLAAAPSLDFSSLDISLPSISEVTRTGSAASTAHLSPLEREIAALRARASLADSERRRFREEKKWALSMGNKARASQMSWQVKRYTALMESFHREADARMIEAAKARDAAAYGVLGAPIVSGSQGIGLMNGLGPMAESSPPLRQRVRGSKSSLNQLYQPARPKDRYAPMVVPEEGIDISPPPATRRRAEEDSFDRSFDSRPSRHKLEDFDRSFESQPRSRPAAEDFDRSFDLSHAETAPLPSSSRQRTPKPPNGNANGHGILGDLNQDPAESRQRLSRHSAEMLNETEAGSTRRRSHTTGAIPNGQRLSKLRASWEGQE
ncbi:hypothetical protein PUNSTDRAFT_132042 [Punctularia strigosozonata HHB-11173 SS5]|uniref:uncharacterized protein n=1 Tax=Punctularia strigosozonata (strain HHB-11173) TaxID=741275 RepID=UPI00044162EE|nr:uncharacterized protein PUNSTDRAFT_132042 [Punctularia strigosozonata HHB-11173 SS5]EIN11895.1 hypothetical protein PUNSTDRAFT_132042 [Punctularia strigosozonata HHB-11173 SS5]